MPKVCAERKGKEVSNIVNRVRARAAGGNFHFEILYDERLEMARKDMEMDFRVAKKKSEEGVRPEVG